MPHFLEMPQSGPLSLGGNQGENRGENEGKKGGNWGGQEPQPQFHPSLLGPNPPFKKEQINRMSDFLR